MRNVEASLLLTEARVLLAKARIPLTAVYEAWDQNATDLYRTPSVLAPMTALESAVKSLDEYIQSVDQNRVKFRHPE